jgi:hypothetical protein
VETAPIVRYMRGWSRDQVRARCTKMGWPITVVRQIQREDVTAPPVKSGITQHEESFETVRSDGSTEFFYFDENSGRPAINGRMTKEAAFAAAQTHLKMKT